MIKFLGLGKEGAALLGLALSESDLARLQAGASLSFGVADLGAELRAKDSKNAQGTVVVFIADEAEFQSRLRALHIGASPAVVPGPRFRALPGKGGPRRRTSAATVARRSRARA